MRHTRSFPILASLTLLVAACTTPAASPTDDGGGSPAASQPPSTATGGTVRIGWAGYPDSLNPGNGVLSEAYTLYGLVFDTPIAVNSAGEYVPELATEWSSSEDGLTWTMTIRDDAVFQDGEPLTAEDVAYSMNLYKETEAFPFLPSYVEPFTSIEATDETTVTLTTEEPIANFEPSMAFIYVLPKHIWEEVEDPVEFGNDEMVGSGPFSLVEADQGVSSSWRQTPSTGERRRTSTA